MPADPEAPIRRNLAAVVRREARRYLIITLTGPRQSGKTTFCRHVFRGKPWVSFENLDVRERAQRDPRGLLAGAYPRLHDRGIPAARWLEDYVATCVQRDVRQVLNVGDHWTFTTFLRLGAGRTAQEVNLSSWGSDAGVSFNTIRAWISVLETSALGFLVPAWHRNARKRWVKAPKLHWTDSGLVFHPPGIGNEIQLRTHPLRGAIFESWVASGIWTAHTNRGLIPDLAHFRQTQGVEVDLGISRGRHLTLVDAKSGATIHEEAFKGLRSIRADLDAGGDYETSPAALVHGGDEGHRRGEITAIPWQGIASRDWTRGSA